MSFEFIQEITEELEAKEIHNSEALFLQHSRVVFIFLVFIQLS